jgi:ATP-dependent Clp protease ATP-binding subunit ClpC
MFEEFTESARRVIVLSQQEARALGHTCIGTEHLLFGALTVCMESGLHDIDTAEARKARELVSGSPDPSPGTFCSSIGRKKVLERSLRSIRYPVWTNHTGSASPSKCSTTSSH